MLYTLNMHYFVNNVSIKQEINIIIPNIPYLNL